MKLRDIIQEIKIVNKRIDVSFQETDVCENFYKIETPEISNMVENIRDVRPADIPGCGNDEDEGFVASPYINYFLFIIHRHETDNFEQYLKRNRIKYVHAEDWYESVRFFVQREYINIVK